MKIRAKSICVLATSLALCALSGCSRGPATVSGKVTRNGTPLTTGVLAFHTPDGKKIAVGIGGDGTYKLTHPPTGTVTVTVELPQAKSGLVASRPRAEDRLGMINAANISIQPKYK